MLIMIICFTFCIMLCAVAFIEGHGGLFERPSISSMFRKGFLTPSCNNDYQQSGEGVSTGNTQVWYQLYMAAFQITPNIAEYCDRCKYCEEEVRNYLLDAAIIQCTSNSKTICGPTSVYHFILDYSGHCGNGMEFLQLNKKCFLRQWLVENERAASDVIILVVCSIVGGLCIVYTILCLYVWIVRKRTVEKETNSRPSISIDIDGPSDDDTISGTYDWIETYRPSAESECKWTRLFQECTTKPEIIDQWENFTRILCIKSSQDSKADQIIAEITRGYEQKRVRERIYNALCLWKEKCYSVGDEHMITIFIDSFYKHQKEHNLTRS